MQLTGKNLTKQYADKQVLQGVDFRVEQGQRVAFMGESGCGKTTLLKMIMGLEKPDFGVLHKEKNLRVSAIFQQPRLCPWLSALDNVLLVKEKSPLHQQQAKELLFQLGITPQDCYQKMDCLSGGQQRRVAIARALFASFDLLLLDEPFQGLDKKNLHIATQLINQYTKNKMLILVTHHQIEAELLQAKIYYLEKGILKEPSVLQSDW